ncbi:MULTISPECIES: hypothetical protein [unclassified Streptomyces]|uniref:hypothetical protein n=1 Tax=unclassified Streptomyces TaxID=2593676 RepID=UPI00081F2063|nr:MULTISPECIES: hypothetical protein [unclassified Streptomyces]SCD31612.1 hypothetical protein GA0115243_100854 [Streptomyces sp. ScaeMP-e83]
MSSSSRTGAAHGSDFVKEASPKYLTNRKSPSVNFAVTADAVRSVFGLTGPRYDAPHSRLNDRTALFLSTVGLPDTEWFMSKASLCTDDPIDVVSWYGSRGTVSGILDRE